jgi:hypothetical protein
MVVFIFSIVASWDEDKDAIASAGVACNVVASRMHAGTGARDWKALVTGTKSVSRPITFMVTVQDMKTMLQAVPFGSRLGSVGMVLFSIILLSKVLFNATKLPSNVETKQ